MQCVAVCCSVLQCVAVCCSVVQCVAACCSVLQCVPKAHQGAAPSLSLGCVVQYVAVCRSALPRVAPTACHREAARLPAVEKNFSKVSSVLKIPISNTITPYHIIQSSYQITIQMTFEKYYHSKAVRWPLSKFSQVTILKS